MGAEGWVLGVGQTMMIDHSLRVGRGEHYMTVQYKCKQTNKVQLNFCKPNKVLLFDPNWAHPH